MGLILPRRRLLLAAPALILPHRRADAQMMQAIVSGSGTVTPPAAWTLLTSGTTTTNASNVYTVGPLDGTGAKLIVFTVAYYNPGGQPATFGDSNGNTYTTPSGGPYTPGTILGVLNAVSVPTTVGPGMTFGVNFTGGPFAVVGVFIFKSGTGTPFYDSTESHNNITSGTSLAIPSFTPPRANDLAFITLADITNSNTYSINSSFSTPVSVPGASGNNIGYSFAWKIQGNSAVTPTWTLGSATTNAAAQAIVMGSV